MCLFLLGVCSPFALVLAIAGSLPLSSCCFTQPPRFPWAARAVRTHTVALAEALHSACKLSSSLGVCFHVASTTAPAECLLRKKWSSRQRVGGSIL